MQSVEDLIAAHSMSLAVEPAGSNPFMPQSADDMDHWRCTVSAETVDGFEVHVSLGPDYGGAPPDLGAVLALVMDDVRSYRECAGYADFAALLGIGSGEEDPAALAAWRELGRVSAAVAAIESLSATPSSAA